MESSIEELFNAINNSNEYKEYKQIVDIIEEDNDIKSSINLKKTLLIIGSKSKNIILSKYLPLKLSIF